MTRVSNLEDKILALKTSFANFIGENLYCFETAELLHDDGTWEIWPDLPVRLYKDANNFIAISWSKFDDLWIATDSSLPFSIDGSTVRWVRNAVESIRIAVGTTIRSVQIGRGQMSIAGNEVEIWTRLLLEVENGWLEIFNSLDENGFGFHVQKPEGEFISCT